MKWVADENIDLLVVEQLRAHGHDVRYVAEGMSEATDEEVLALADNGSALLLTADKDFGELVFRQGRSSAGVVLLRLPGVSGAAKATRLIDVIRNHQNELSGAFTVIARRTVRIRRA